MQMRAAALGLRITPKSQSTTVVVAAGSKGLRKLGRWSECCLENYTHVRFVTSDPHRQTRSRRTIAMKVLLDGVVRRALSATQFLRENCSLGDTDVRVLDLLPN